LATAINSTPFSKKQITIKEVLLKKESEFAIAIPFTGALLLFWVFALLMSSSGGDNPSNTGWTLVSGIRWILTAAGFGYIAYRGATALLVASEKETQRRKEAYEQAVNNEVERRLQAIRQKEWEREESKRKLKAQKEEEERIKREKERVWREEFERKLAEEFRPNQTMSSGTEKALEEFI
jgi:hypothetical protein